MNNLKANLRARELVREMKEFQVEIDAHKPEEAAEAKRLFEDEYRKEKDDEVDLQNQVSWYLNQSYD